MYILRKTCMFVSRGGFHRPKAAPNARRSLLWQGTPCGPSSWGAKWVYRCSPFDSHLQMDTVVSSGV